MAGVGSKPGERRGGRQKGTPNKVNAKMRAEVVATGETPLAYMLRRMRDRTVDNAERDKLAVAAAPYVHARLNSIEAKITHRDEMTADELRRSIAADLAAAGIESPAFTDTDGEDEAGETGRLN